MHTRVEASRCVDVLCIVELEEPPIVWEVITEEERRQRGEQKQQEEQEEK